MNDSEIVQSDLSTMSPQQKYTLLVALLTMGIGQVVAFVPNLANQQQNLISAGSFVLAVAILIAGSIHHHAQAVAAAKPPLSAADRLRAQIRATGHTPEV